MTQTESVKHAIGIDVGGTKIEAAVVSSLGNVLNPIRLPTPKETNTLTEAIKQIVDDLKRIAPIEGIGFSLPGSIDPLTGILRNAPNSPTINNTDYFLSLKEELPLPCLFENDANCLILSEHFFGVAKKYKNAVGLIMGTGFGSGVIIDNKLLTGSTGLAPELGHTVINFKGRQCHCGKRGCVEAYLSGSSILKRYHEAKGQTEIKDTRALFKQKRKDHLADHIINETLNIFSIVVGNVVSIYDPEIIVLGGGLSQQPLYYQYTHMIKENVFGSKKTPPIRPAKYGDASGKLGAAALFF
ncbi:MAG: ROK family protein [bacterium]|nr:ROK family protein [bacterium]MBU1918078.1 ROK family protein [bacterium]